MLKVFCRKCHLLTSILLVWKWWRYPNMCTYSITELLSVLWVDQQPLLEFTSIGESVLNCKLHPGIQRSDWCSLLHSCSQREEKCIEKLGKVPRDRQAQRLISGLPFIISPPLTNSLASCEVHGLFCQPAYIFGTVNVKLVPLSFSPHPHTENSPVTKQTRVNSVALLC